jgi:putative FmdB family regulatory protein
MPTYEYVCQKCGHEFEQFQSMKAAPLKKCPKCHKQALKRLVGSGAGLIFKGSGFYITDYRKTASPKESGGGEAKSGGETKSDGGGKAGGNDKAGGDAKSASPSAGSGTSSGATSGGSPSNSSTPKSPPAKK